MGENIEAELRRLVQHLSERATRAGGMDRLTYDALRAASAALSSLALAEEHQDQEEALRALRACLHAREGKSDAKAA